MTAMKKKTPTHVGEHGDHPVGGAVGAAVGAAAGAAAVGAAQGAAIGSVVGVPGMAAGIAIGGVAGALAGKAIAQDINPTTEDAYWSENFKDRPYAAGKNYETYKPAYMYGVECYGSCSDKSFDEIEPQLSKDWEQRNQGSLTWDEARPATRDAFERLRSKSNR